MECPPWGVFLKNPNPYLRKFRGKPLPSFDKVKITKKKTFPFIFYLKLDPIKHEVLKKLHEQLKYLFYAEYICLFKKCTPI